MNSTLLRRPEHNQVKITEGFWKEQLDKIQNITIWDVLNKFENDHEEGIMKNYEWVAEGKDGKHVGPPWYDGLICEVIRAISDFIAVSYDERLDKKIEYYTEKITKAQSMDRDGYINTYTTLICPDKRWGLNGGSLIWQHDTYNIGCLIEAGIHYYKAVGKLGLLKCGIRAADCMCKIMGESPRKNIVPAHSLAEEALVKLYNLLRKDTHLTKQLEEDGFSTHPNKYLELVKFWMDHRGIHHNRESFPHYMGEYAQDHCRIEEQSEAVGHAVRAALLYTGLTALGVETEDEKYLNAVKRIWDNVEQTKLHISGGIGAVHNEERFGYQYDLPNDAYLETCAGVALVFWAGEMYQAFGESRYMDVFECALYNNILPGLSADGTHYFYENPLISNGSIERWSWHSCPCCPPMFLKMMGSLQDYIYASDNAHKVAINLYVGSCVKMMMQGSEIGIEQKECGLPFKGQDKIILHSDGRKTFTIAIRKPAWVNAIKVTVGKETFSQCNEKGYVEITKLWGKEEVIKVSMELMPIKVEAHPFVNADVGKVALQRGPLLYCLEEIDNPIDTNITLDNEELRIEQDKVFGGIVCIKGKCDKGNDFTAIPYYLWNNRGKGKMQVWIKQQKRGMTTDKKVQEVAGEFAAHITRNNNVADLNDWKGKLYRRYFEK